MRCELNLVLFENLNYKIRNFEYIVKNSIMFNSILYIFWKMVFARTLPANKKLFAGTLPANKNLFAGTLLANKNLFAGTIALF